MLKIDNFFKNRIFTPNLIFRDKENKGVNVIYYPELGSTGVEFANKYRKKNYWEYFVIPPAIMFLSHKVLTNSYLKDFKKNIPMVRVQRKFLKTANSLKSVVVDLTPMSHNFAAFTKSRSKKQTTEAFLEIVSKFAADSNATGKETYLMIDNKAGSEKDMVESLFYVTRLNGNKLRVKGIEGILVYGGGKFWPLTIKESDKDGDYFKINVNIYSRYMKDVQGEEVQEEIKPKESVQQTKEMVKALYQVHQDSLKSATSGISGVAKKTIDIEENPLELIKNEVVRNKNIKGKSFEEKLSNLFKEPSEGEGKRENNKDKKTTKIVEDISKELLALNKKYNGTMELDEATVLSSRDSFYNPLNVIGFNDFNGYNKQKTEFGDTLDQSIFDLVKSMEDDKELGIKVLSIKPEITDTNRDRFKTYKIRIQHKKFGHDKPYTISFHVPVPSKGKYLKLGGNEYIMISQFFPKPVVKVAADMVRVYTHFSTAAVFIKTHSFNANNDVKGVIDDFGRSLKRNKKLKGELNKMTPEEAQEIIHKYDLPDFLPNDIFVNMTIK